MSSVHLEKLRLAEACTGCIGVTGDSWKSARCGVAGACGSTLMLSFPTVARVSTVCSAHHTPSGPCTRIPRCRDHSGIDTQRHCATPRTEHVVHY